MSILISLFIAAWICDKILRKIGKRLTAEYNFHPYNDARSIIFYLEAFIGLIVSLVTLIKFNGDYFFFCLFAIWIVFAIIFTLHAKRSLSLVGALLVSVLQAFVGYFGTVVGILNFMAPAKKDFGGIATAGAKVSAEMHGGMESNFWEERGTGYADAGAWANTDSSYSGEEFDSKKHWDMEQLQWEASRNGYTDVDSWASAGGYSNANDAYNNGYFDDKTRY